jgi:hypothetical protein
MSLLLTGESCKKSDSKAAETLEDASENRIWAPDAERGEERVKSDKEDLFPLNMHKGGRYKSLEQIRLQALSIISHRNKEEPEALSMITGQYWMPEFVFDGQKMSGQDQFKGYWLSFEEDFTYSYGVNEKKLGKGRYHFRLDDKSLYMVDDDVSLEPKVWTANHNGRAIALIGTQEYNINNGMQVKMIASNQKPAI